MGPHEDEIKEGGSSDSRGKKRKKKTCAAGSVKRVNRGQRKAKKENYFLKSGGSKGIGNCGKGPPLKKNGWEESEKERGGNVKRGE